MNNTDYKKVHKLVNEQYHGKHKEEFDKSEVKAAALAEAKKILAEEQARGLDATATRMGVRTRVHAYLQGIVPVCDPEIKTSSSAKKLREELDNHHNHQTAHFTSLWVHTDTLVDEVMGGTP